LRPLPFEDELSMYNMSGSARSRGEVAMTNLLERLVTNGAHSTRTPSSKAEWVAATIERHIREERLAPGTLVGTREQLKAALDVAPSTIEEAIRLLTARGLVSTRTGPGGGVFVTEASVMVQLGRTIM